jgi:hypothetical protein
VTVTRILPSEWKQTPANLLLESTLFAVCIFLGQRSIDFHLRSFCFFIPPIHHIFYIFHNWRYIILLSKITQLLSHSIFRTSCNCIILFHFPNFSVPAVHNSQDRPKIHYQRTARGEQSVSARSFETSDLLRQHNVLMKILRPLQQKWRFCFRKRYYQQHLTEQSIQLSVCEIHIKRRHLKQVHNNRHVNVISKVSSRSQSLSQSYWKFRKRNKAYCKMGLVQLNEILWHNTEQTNTCPTVIGIWTGTLWTETPLIAPQVLF